MSAGGALLPSRCEALAEPEDVALIGTRAEPPQACDVPVELSLRLEASTTTPIQFGRSRRAASANLRKNVLRSDGRASLTEASCRRQNGEAARAPYSLTRRTRHD